MFIWVNKVYYQWHAKSQGLFWAHGPFIPMFMGFWYFCLVCLNDEVNGQTPFKMSFRVKPLNACRDSYGFDALP